MDLFYTICYINDSYIFPYKCMTLRKNISNLLSGLWRLWLIIYVDLLYSIIDEQLTVVCISSITKTKQLLILMFTNIAKINI